MRIETLRSAGQREGGHTTLGAIAHMPLVRSMALNFTETIIAHGDLYITDAYNERSFPRIYSYATTVLRNNLHY